MKVDTIIRQCSDLATLVSNFSDHSAALDHVAAYLDAAVGLLHESMPEISSKSMAQEISTIAKDSPQRLTGELVTINMQAENQEKRYNDGEIISLDEKATILKSLKDPCDCSGNLMTN